MNGGVKRILIVGVVFGIIPFDCVIAQDGRRIADDHLAVLKAAKSVTITENPRRPRLPPRLKVIEDPDWIADLATELQFDGAPYREPTPLKNPIRVEVRPKPGAFYAFTLSEDRLLEFHPAGGLRVRLKSLDAYQRVAKVLDAQTPERVGPLRLHRKMSRNGPRGPQWSIMEDFYVCRDAKESYFVSSDKMDFFWCMPPLPAAPGRWDETWWIAPIGFDDLETSFRDPHRMAVSPDEKWIVVLHVDGVSTINAAAYKGHRGMKRPTWLSPKPHPDHRFHLTRGVFGKAVYGIGKNGLASFLLDESTGELRLVQGEVLDSPLALALSPDSNHLYVASSKSLSVFECLDNGRMKTLDQREADEPTDLAVSPDGKYLYLAKADAIDIWNRDPETGGVAYQKTEGLRPNQMQQIDVLRVSPRGDTLIAASTSRGIANLIACGKDGKLAHQSSAQFAIEEDSGLVNVQYDTSGKKVYVVQPKGRLTVLEIQ